MGVVRNRKEGKYRRGEGTTPTCDHNLPWRPLRVKLPTSWSWAGKYQLRQNKRNINRRHHELQHAVVLMLTLTLQSRSVLSHKMCWSVALATSAKTGTIHIHPAVGNMHHDEDKIYETFSRTSSLYVVIAIFGVIVRSRVLLQTNCVGFQIHMYTTFDDWLCSALCYTTTTVKSWSVMILLEQRTFKVQNHFLGKEHYSTKKALGLAVGSIHSLTLFTSRVFFFLFFFVLLLIAESISSSVCLIHCGGGTTVFSFLLVLFRFIFFLHLFFLCFLLFLYFIECARRILYDYKAHWCAYGIRGNVVSLLFRSLVGPQNFCNSLWMKNRHEHRLCWMPTGRRNGLMWKHTHR